MEGGRAECVGEPIDPPKRNLYIYIYKKKNFWKKIRKGKKTKKEKRKNETGDKHSSRGWGSTMTRVACRQFFFTFSQHAPVPSYHDDEECKKLSNNITKGCRGDHNASIACAGRAGRLTLGSVCLSGLFALGSVPDSTLRLFAICFLYACVRVSCSVSACFLCVWACISVFFFFSECKNVGKESKKEKSHTNLLEALRDVKGVWCAQWHGEKRKNRGDTESKKRTSHG